MTNIIAQNVGIDISNATLDVHLHPAGIARQFANDARGIKALLEWLAVHDVARIVFEPTGPYHHTFERRLGAAGLPLAKVNPTQVRHFAQVIGTHAKTDAIDAAILARMGALLALPVRPITSQIIDETKELHGPGKRSHRCQEPRARLPRTLAQASCRPAPRPDRPADRRHRFGSQSPPASRYRTGRTL